MDDLEVVRPKERENWIAVIRRLIVAAREHNLTSVCYAIDCEFLLEELERAEERIADLEREMKIHR